MAQKLKEMHLDFLKELGSMGAGNASALLSTLTGKEVNVTVSTCKMVSPKNISDFVAIKKELVVIQYAPISGELVGNILLVFPRESALSLLDLLQKRELGTTKWLAEEEQRILKKTSHFLVNCYINAIQGFLDIVIEPSDLRIFSVFGDTIIDLINITLKKSTKQVFLLNTEMSIKPNIKGEIFFLFEEALTYLLFKKGEELFKT